MEQEKMKEQPFVAVVDDNKDTMFINLNQVHYAVLTFRGGKPSCRLNFGSSSDENITIHAEGAVFLYDRLAERACALNGEDLQSVQELLRQDDTHQSE